MMGGAGAGPWIWPCDQKLNVARRSVLPTQSFTSRSSWEARKKIRPTTSPTWSRRLLAFSAGIVGGGGGSGSGAAGFGACFGAFFGAFFFGAAAFALSGSGSGSLPRLATTATARGAKRPGSRPAVWPADAARPSWMGRSFSADQARRGSSPESPTRGIADDRVVAGVVGGGPQIGERRLVELLAEPESLDLRRQVGGELGVALVEDLHRPAHRFPVEQAAQGALESAGLRPGAGPHQGEAPGPVHVADDRERPALRVAEQPLRQAAQEGSGRERPALLALAGEFVPARRAGAEA